MIVVVVFEDVDAADIKLLSYVRKNLINGATEVLAFVQASENETAEGVIGQFVLNPYQEGRISREGALDYADNSEQMERRMR